MRPRKRAPRRRKGSHEEHERDGQEDVQNDGHEDAEQREEEEKEERVLTWPTETANRHAQCATGSWS